MTFLTEGAWPFVYEWVNLGKVRTGCVSVGYAVSERKD